MCQRVAVFLSYSLEFDNQFGLSAQDLPSMVIAVKDKGACRLKDHKDHNGALSNEFGQANVFEFLEKCLSSL